MRFFASLRCDQNVSCLLVYKGLRYLYTYLNWDKYD